MTGEVPDDKEYMIPFGHARLTRAGQDVTIVSTGLLLGWTPIVKGKVRKDAQRRLAAFDAGRAKAKKGR